MYSDAKIQIIWIIPNDIVELLKKTDPMNADTYHDNNK